MDSPRELAAELRAAMQGRGSRDMVEYQVADLAAIAAELERGADAIEAEATRIATAREGIFEAINAERERQERLLVERNWKWSMATPGIDPALKLMPLMEETGEVAHAVRVAQGFAVAGNSHDNHGLRAELVQVAACAVAWLEALNEEANLLAAASAVEGSNQ